MNEQVGLLNKEKNNIKTQKAGRPTTKKKKTKKTKDGWMNEQVGLLQTNKQTTDIKKEIKESLSVRRRNVIKPEESRGCYCWKGAKESTASTPVWRPERLINSKKFSFGRNFPADVALAPRCHSLALCSGQGAISACYVRVPAL